MKTIKVKTDKITGDVFLDISDFKDILNISKVQSYTLEQLDDNGEICLILKFYDKDGNYLKCGV